MKTIETTIVCDLDQQTPATSMRFGYKGKAYVIDLCEDCRAVFDVYWKQATLVKETMRERKKATTE